MAYLQFEHIQSASTGIVAGKPQPALGAFERDIVRMSLQDGRSSLADIGRLVRIGMWLGGVRRKGGLANPRLEALRRYAILYRLNGQGLEASEELAMDRAGFDARGIGEVRRIVDRHVAANPQGPGPWLHILPLALALVAGLAGTALLIRQTTGDIAISTMIAALALVTIVSLHRPAMRSDRRRAS